MALDEIFKLWIPFLVFTNTENNEATMGTEDTEVTITRCFLFYKYCNYTLVPLGEALACMFMGRIIIFYY